MKKTLKKILTVNTCKAHAVPVWSVAFFEWGFGMRLKRFFWRPPILDDAAVEGKENGVCETHHNFSS